MLSLVGFLGRNDDCLTALKTLRIFVMAPPGPQRFARQYFVSRFDLFQFSRNAPKPLIQQRFRYFRFSGTISLRSRSSVLQHRLHRSTRTLGLATYCTKPGTRMHLATQLWYILVRDTVWKRWLRFAKRRHNIAETSNIDLRRNDQTATHNRWTGSGNFEGSDHRP